MLNCKKSILLAITAIFFFPVFQLSAQQTASIKSDRCGSMIWLESMFKDNPGYRLQFQENERKLGEEINRMMKENKNNTNTNRTSSISTIPVIFHVVLTNQLLVPDAMIIAQLNRLNLDYSGLNADSANGSAFFSLRGHSKIQFCLAQRTPANTATNGIDRVISSTVSNSSNSDPIKSTAAGGADAWDPAKYINIWIGQFSQSDLLGYGTFPVGSPENPSGPQSEQGIVIHPGPLPGGSKAPFNLGRSLTHELGHYLFLRHIWGDDTPNSSFTCPTSGGCNGSDFQGTLSLDDTPNQCAATNGCLSGIQTDICSPSSPGYMYQNFMDYTDDPCMTMFTKGQNLRAEAAINTYRPGLLTSNGCLPPVFVPNNASIFSINSPINNFRTCDATIPLSVTLRNTGSNQLNTVVITVKRNGTTVQTFSQSGLNLITNANLIINLNPVSLVAGLNNIEVCSSLPNGLADGDPTDDCKTINGTRSVVNTPLPFSEGFEGVEFPPTGWFINNPDNNITWQKNTDGVSHSGISKAFVDNYNYGSPDQADDLVTPPLLIGTADSLWVSFWGAYRGFTGNPSEKILIAVSTDCGTQFSSVYFARNDTSLVAPAGSSPTQETPYIPSNTNQWIRKSVDLTSFINAGKIQVMFRSINADGNNVYIDDININKKTFPNNDAGVIAVNNPQTRMCTNSGAPLVTIKNFGKTNLTSVKINYQLDGTGPVTTFNWTGNLSRNQTSTVTLSLLNFGALGFHSLNVFTSEPNNVSDQDITNDALVKPFQTLQIISLQSGITEEFSNSNFPPANWNVYNPDADMTWTRNATIGKKSTGSAFFNDFRNNTIDRVDDLALPNYSYAGIDSIFTTFNLANIAKTAPGTNGSRLDTLSVLLSKDCGNTYTTIYKKYGSDLQTVINPTSQLRLNDFFPTNSQWRMDSLNLGNWLGSSEPQFQLVFRFHGNFENNLFLDDVNIRTEILPEKLKSVGYLVLPNPFHSSFSVWFYQEPVALQFINVYNSVGQLVWSKQFAGNAGKITDINMDNKAPGIYTVTLGYKDRKNNVNIQVVKL